ncbi:unnamed protein product [Gadus morhua 'NCC']
MPGSRKVTALDFVSGEASGGLRAADRSLQCESGSVFCSGLPVPSSLRWGDWQAFPSACTCWGGGGGEGGLKRSFHSNTSTSTPRGRRSALTVATGSHSNELLVTGHV